MRTNLIRDEGGAALIEAALVLPIILLLIFGLTEISLYFWARTLAEKAVHLGARRAILSDSIASGPGLDSTEGTTYWESLSPGTRCFQTTSSPRPCPEFVVECSVGAGCSCSGDACRFRFASARIGPILGAMRAVLPDLTAENLSIRYATNGLGYVGRPGPVPVNVTVTLVNRSYTTLFLGDLFGTSLPLRASAEMPSEDLRSH